MSGPAASAIYFLSPLVAATLTLVLAGLVVQAGIAEHNRRVFLLVLISLAAWALFTFGMRTSRTLQAAWTWNRLVAVGLLSLFVTYFHFCHLYMGSSRRWPIVVLYLFAVPAAVVVLLTRLAVRGMTRAGYGYAPEVGLAGTIIFGAVYVLMGINLVRLLRARRRFAASDKRNRFLVLAVAGLLPLFGMLADGFTDLPPVGIWTHLGFCTICTFAILRYRLFDLRVVARKGLTHLLVGTLVAAPFVGAVLLADNLFSDRTSLVWIYVGAMGVFGVLMWPAYEWARRRVDRLLFSARHDLLEQVRALARNVDATTGFEEVASRLTRIVSQALNASTVTLLQPAGEGGELRVAARDGGPAGSETILRPGSPVVRWLAENRRTLRNRTLSVDPSLQNLPQTEREALDSLATELLVPLVTPRGHLSGVLLVGPPSSRRSYSTEDCQLLDGLGGEAALALENARLYRDALRARETLHAWLDNLPDAVLIVDGAGVVRFLNREGSRRFGTRSGQGTFLLRTSRPANGKPQRFAETIRGREYEIASAPLVGPEGELSTVFVLRDVSERQEEKRERKQLEARARLASHLASVGEMASGIAHEINNPLTAVVGYSEMLAASPLPEESRETVELILQGANRVAAIVRRLLTFARQQEVERASVNINEVVRSTLALRAYVLRTGNIRVTTELDPDLPPTVADGQQMQQVLLNLIVNAEKAIRDAAGRGEISVSSGREGDCILVRVRDDGPGIPLEIQDRIFDPFFTTRSVGEGTGLGLSICHGIVTEHGGRISVHSRPGGGAEFVVELPIVTAAQGGEGPAVAAPAPRSAAARLLVVDDEPSVRTLLRRILEEAGHHVDTAADGNEALARMGSTRYALVLMDVRMPGLSGIEVFERLSERGRSGDSRIVFLTGDVMAGETQELIRRTGAPVITKPFHTGEVLEMIAELLESDPQPGV
jgi:signal transduction histidine kinase/CheY-like chemotaxis protein